jgi:glutamate--cysteine ligase
MSLDRTRESAPIGSLDDLTGLLRQAEKPRERWRVGMEHEKVGVLAGTTLPVPYEGRASIAEVLRRFSRFEYTPYLENGSVIAAEQPGRTISLEPGGQLELSGRPFECAHACKSELLQHIARARAVGRELGIRWLSVGYRPFGTVHDAEWIPKARYQVMREYLPRKGKLALDMMLMTATVQANYDFASEQDMVQKVRTAASVSSVVTAIFANSFLVNGKDSGHASYRYAVWLDVDPDRCGLLPFVFDEDFGYRRYVEWALDVPMFFVRREGRYLPADHLTFRRFMKEGLGEHRATVADFEVHLTTLFPEVRVKNVIEVRGADAGDPAMNAALPALWKGILYDEGACRAAWELLADLSFAERLQLQLDVARSGLAARCRKGDVLGLARELTAIAAAGLKAQPCEHEGEGSDERVVLDALGPILEDGRAPADVWRARWNGDLGRDPAKLVEAIAY